MSPSDIFRPHTLSVTSLGDTHLRQFDAADGDELRRVRLPDYMRRLSVTRWSHRLERSSSVTTTNHSIRSSQLRQFSGQLAWPEHTAADRLGNVFVAYWGYARILLLALHRVIIDERQLIDSQQSCHSYMDGPRKPSQLFHTDQSGQMLVGFTDGNVAVFDVLRR